MKQITFSDGSVFGPFQKIVELEDRYFCDDTLHIQYDVVGGKGTIGDYVPPPEPEPAPETLQG